MAAQAAQLSMPTRLAIELPTLEGSTLPLRPWNNSYPAGLPADPALLRTPQSYRTPEVQRRSPDAPQRTPSDNGYTSPLVHASGSSSPDGDAREVFDDCSKLQIHVPASLEDHKPVKLKLTAADFEVRFDEAEVRRVRRQHADMRSGWPEKPFEKQLASNNVAAVLPKSGKNQQQSVPERKVPQTEAEADDEALAWFMRPACIMPNLLDLDPSWRAGVSLWDDEGRAIIPGAAARKRNEKTNASAAGQNATCATPEKKKNAPRPRPTRRAQSADSLARRGHMAARGEFGGGEEEEENTSQPPPSTYRKRAAPAPVPMSLPIYFPAMPSSPLRINRPQTPAPAGPISGPNGSCAYSTNTAIAGAMPPRPSAVQQRAKSAGGGGARLYTPSMATKSASCTSSDSNLHLRLPNLRRNASMFPTNDGNGGAAAGASNAQHPTSARQMVVNTGTGMGVAQDLRALRIAAVAAVTAAATAGAIPPELGAQGTRYGRPGFASAAPLVGAARPFQGGGGAGGCSKVKKSASAVVEGGAAGSGGLGLQVGGSVAPCVMRGAPIHASNPGLLLGAAMGISMSSPSLSAAVSSKYDRMSGLPRLEFSRSRYLS